MHSTQPSAAALTTNTLFTTSSRCAIIFLAHFFFSVSCISVHFGLFYNCFLTFFNMASFARSYRWYHTHTHVRVAAIHIVSNATQRKRVAIWIAKQNQLLYSLLHVAMLSHVSLIILIEMDAFNGAYWNLLIAKWWMASFIRHILWLIC